MSRIASRIAIAILLASAVTAGAETPNGRNAKMVIFDANGAGGAFLLTATPGQWVETGDDHGKVNFNFRETGRDDWSIYLRDASRNVDLQLDLHTKKVMFKDKSNPAYRQIATITGADARVHGWMVKSVEFAGQPGGSFTRSGKEWLERATGNATVRFRFAETGRDDWSVYLRDASRGVDLQLDLHTGNIYWSDAKTPRTVLYRIAKSN